MPPVYHWLAHMYSACILTRDVRAAWHRQPEGVHYDTCVPMACPHDMHAPALTPNAQVA